MSGEENLESDFIPREYQVEILDQALKKNIIVYLPTGSGKTFIATMFLKSLSKEIEGKFTDGNKRSFFLVNNVPLVIQQAEAMRKQLPLNIGEYSGDKGVDFWDKHKWEEELDKNNILVMTVQIFLDMVLHSMISITQVNAIVFDECHHSVNDHPMRQVMRQIDLLTDESLKPRTMGLTATLLNSNCKPHQVEKEIQILETTFHSKVVSATNSELVKIYSTNPQELLLFYSPNGSSILNMDLQNCIEFIGNIISNLELEVDMNEILSRPEKTVVLPSKKRSFARKLLNSVKEIKVIFEDLGLYAADKAALIRVIQFEKDKLTTSEMERLPLLSVVTTRIHLLRHQFQKVLTRVDENEQPFVFASDKLKTLFQYLEGHKKDRLSLVFVEQRITAQVLFHVFQVIKGYQSVYKDIKPDFIVGKNNSMLKNCEEVLYERYRNNLILEQFSSKKINLLFASDVAEEGIDIGLCNEVIKFDEIRTFRSYIQSKGRARHIESKYIFFIEKSEKKKQESIQKVQNYKTMEKVIKNLLCRGQSNLEELDENSDNVPRYFTRSGSCVTANSAISLINRYCHSLPQDKFSKLIPYWWMEKVSLSDKLTKFVVILQLPGNSPIKEKLKSRPCNTRLSAKQDVAVKACMLLHKAGELSDNLLPVGKMSKLIFNENLYPNWDATDQMGSISGTKKCLRKYDLSFPKWVYGVQPKPGVPVFLHIIAMKPNYEVQKVNHKKVFYHLLNSEQGFSIITSTEWPELCGFPLYLNTGEVTINVKVNAEVLTLSEKDIITLKEFHNLLFSNAHSFLNNYHVKDHENKENSYLIVPTKGSSIDWDTIKSYTPIKQDELIPENIGKNVDLDEIATLGKVVVPLYKTTEGNTRFIVCDIDRNMSPKSPFPKSPYESYSHYFQDKYGVKVMDQNQPMLEVREISRKLNCLIPRSTKKKRKPEELEGLHLIPELCQMVSLPAVYSLKLTMIPSLLHRIHYLMLAEELQQKIVKETNLGLTSIHHDKNLLLMPLGNDNSNINQNTHKRKELLVTNNNANDFVDILGSLDVSIETIRKFTESNLFSELPDNSSLIKKRSTCHVEKLSVLNVSPEDNLGPQQSEFLQVLITKSSGDIVNYERLETLGDSFLKFAVSLALFLCHPLEDEGKLTVVKGKIIGNRNLFYCGKNINLGSIVKVNEFSSVGLDIPGFTLSRDVQQIMREDEIPCSNLANLKISKKEFEDGLLENESLINFLAQCNSDEVEDNFNMRAIRQQLVSDKTIADVVEALIGLYLKSVGVVGAFHLLEWLGVLTKEMADTDILLYRSFDSACTNPWVVVDKYIVSPNVLEENLGYKFKDRSLLLQALTHPSAMHNITDCYQRLEFLGDAILDFLITVYIFDNCGNLSPGEITDLRSALVNNITFACLTVRFGFYKHLVFSGYNLTELINKFVKHQEKNNHTVNTEVLYLVKEEDVKVAELIDVPKVLGDIFEALAGAVFLDSNKNLETVWEVFYTLLEKEIKEFSAAIPINPTRLLYETFTVPSPRYGSVKFMEDSRIMIPLKIVYNGEEKYFHGLGENKISAKEAAAKIALKHFKIT